MKGSLKNSEVKHFNPFTVSIEIETVEEARLLYHLINHSQIGDLIRNDNEYVGDQCYDPFCRSLSLDFLLPGIVQSIKSQGFKL